MQIILVSLVILGTISIVAGSYPVVVEFLFSARNLSGPGIEANLQTYALISHAKDINFQNYSDVGATELTDKEDNRNPDWGTLLHVTLSGGKSVNKQILKIDVLGLNPDVTGELIGSTFFKLSSLGLDSLGNSEGSWQASLYASGRSTGELIMKGRLYSSGEGRSADSDPRFEFPLQVFVYPKEPRHSKKSDRPPTATPL